MKRPNLYENISFLIRRKREIKNKSTMKKINQSKYYMTEEVIKTEGQSKWFTNIYDFLNFQNINP